MMRRVLIALALPLALAGCFGSSDKPMQGYVEGVFVYVAAEGSGRVVERPVSAGGRVAAGDLLFALDDADAAESVSAAEARLAQARAQVANLQTGKRPEEIAVLEAQVSQMRSTYSNLDEDLKRKLQLRERGVVTQAAVDAAKSARDAADAQVQAAERQLEVANLPARPEEIEAAEKNVAAQEAALAQARIALDRRKIRAPDAGLIAETYYEIGEQVSAGQAVVSLLPDANRKIRFFVPEATLSEVAPGKTVSLACDGCPSGMTAEITFVSATAEFTPPVIYSKDSRSKLVFRVDARPLGDAVSLKVGQPLDIRLVP